MTGEKVSVARAGRVVEVNFQVGSRVKQGDVLIRLDDTEIKTNIRNREQAIKSSEADLAELDKQETFLAQKYQADKTKAERELEQAQEEVRQKKEVQVADVAKAKAELRNAEQEEHTESDLYAKGSGSRSQLEERKKKTEIARADLRKAQIRIDDKTVGVKIAALDQLTKEYALKRSELEMKRETTKRELANAKKDLAKLELDLKETVIYAHTDGVVTSGEVRVGDSLEAGKAVLAIAQEIGFRVDVAVPSAEIGHIQVGMQVRIKLDAYHYQQYGTVNGTVYHIPPDSQRPEGQQTVIYVVKVQLEGDEVGRGDLRGQVKLGMTGQAEIVTGKQSVLSLLVKKIRQTISLG